jgi:cob(I)alamin adenosyltransferase
LVLLDEVHIAIKLGYLNPDKVLEGLQSRHPMTHVITSGRYAPDVLIEAADLVTEMKEIKHYYQQGVPARDGIEK